MRAERLKLVRSTCSSVASVEFVYEYVKVEVILRVVGGCPWSCAE